MSPRLRGPAGPREAPRGLLLSLPLRHPTAHAPGGEGRQQSTILSPDTLRTLGPCFGRMQLTVGGGEILQDSCINIEATVTLYSCNTGSKARESLSSHPHPKGVLCVASAPLQGSAWFPLDTDGWGWGATGTPADTSQVRDSAVTRWRPQNGPGPALQCAGGLLGRVWEVPPFGAMVSKPFSMGGRTGEKLEIKSQASRIE